MLEPVFNILTDEDISPLQVAVYSKGQLLKGWEIEKIDEKYNKMKIVLDFTKRSRNNVQVIDKRPTLKIDGREYTIDDLPKEALVARRDVENGETLLLVALINTGVFKLVKSTEPVKTEQTTEEQLKMLHNSLVTEVSNILSSIQETRNQIAKEHSQTNGNTNALETHIEAQFKDLTEIVKQILRQLTNAHVTVNDSRNIIEGMRQDLLNFKEILNTVRDQNRSMEKKQ